ncbi:MAG: hypothetical protein ACK5OW_01920, partial [bacterium]
EEYSTKALYDVIKLNLLLKDKDLLRFIRTSNDEILAEYKKIKNKPSLTLNDITNKYESYTIVYMTIRGIMANVNIVKHQEVAREITNLFLNDVLEEKFNDKPASTYDND